MELHRSGDTEDPVEVARPTHAGEHPGLRHGSKGFTLIELMIAVAVIAILAAVAYPAYQKQIMNARRTDGTAPLLMLATQLEKYAYDNGTYAGATVPNLIGSATTSEGYYTVAIAAATAACPIADCYLITATPVAGTPQANDTECNALTLSSIGIKNATGTCTGSNQCQDLCW